MATTLVPGQTTWSGEKDVDGNRIYKIKFLVRSDDPKDGPATVMQTTGLPESGNIWVVDNDEDLWAYFSETMSATPRISNEPNKLWDVECTATTKSSDKRCKDSQIDNPLLIPDRISGAGATYQEEATYDRFGLPITNSAWEQLRGSQVQFDKGRATVKIEQNRTNLELALLASMQDTVNAFPLWGLPPRTIKLSKYTWNKKFYGQCFIFWERVLEFDIRFDTFDRVLLDESNKVLNGHWGAQSGTGLAGTSWVLDNINGQPPSYLNPQHFIRAKDRQGNPMKIVLNGRGQPAGVVTSDTGYLISIIDGNTGEALTNPSFWRAIVGPTTPVLFDAATSYPAGSLVSLNGEFWLALVPYVANSGFPPSPVFPTNWGTLPTGVANAGEYDATVRYDTGFFVKNPATMTPGQIPVQKYNASDFLLLGLPVSLDTTM